MVGRIRAGAWVLSSLCLTILVVSCVQPILLTGVRDEASRAGRSADSFQAAAEDYFHEMDSAQSLTRDEIRGRNTWLVWTGGNDRLWDELTKSTFGSFDLLKILSSHPNLPFNRDSRWRYLGLVNEPCFTKATAPNPERYGLWLDSRRSDCPPDPFEDERRYPGVAVGARGRNLLAGSFYGYASGIVGLRLFPNPDFDVVAARRWDAERFYNDPTYYLSKNLVRPYRVGMSCAFCHVGPNPEQPPADPERPGWANLSSLVGAQYFWVDRIFSWSSDESNFFFQQLHTARPGSLDTSLVSTDNINNPRTMNAVYNLGARLEAARRWDRESLAGGALNNRQFNDYVSQGPLAQFFQPPATVWTPHVLKDGADSAGALAALNRVYINIGLFSEEWLRHFNPILGGKQVTPIEISTLRANSNYWHATEAQTPDMALFLLRASVPHRLRNAPGGTAFLTADGNQLRRGRIVFAENCAGCHSSKAPVPPADANVAGCAGPGYLDCWNRYWQWTQTEDFRRQMRQIALSPDFLDGNYLSNDMRVPITLLQTNACSPLATNAIRGNIWDNFSSESYKQLPSVGTVTIYNPLTGEPQAFRMPAGGRGYTRVPTLVSMWSTAPFLLNNSVGPFNPDPSVPARLASFQESITQLLWPERRRMDPVFGNRVPGVIDRTTAPSYLRVPAGYLPDFVRRSEDIVSLLIPSLFNDGGLEIGPIPSGVPVGLLSNLSPLPETDDLQERLAHDRDILKLLVTLIRDLKALPHGATEAQARQVFMNLAEPLFRLSKCPDYVVNRGHYFGAALPDTDKLALIAFLKTL